MSAETRRPTGCGVETLPISARAAAALLLAASLTLLAGCSTAGTRTSAGAAGTPGTPAPAPPPAVRLLDGVAVQPRSFDPSTGGTVQVSYTLAGDARVTVSIYGPNRELVARPVADEPRAAGDHREAWDGRDATGAIVPDEAYYPVVEAASVDGVDVYDPVATSGGERVNPSDIHFKAREGLISYVLPEPSRVLVRAGLDQGPMLATIVNWELRGAGLSTERWSGRDQQGLRSFALDPDALVIVQAYALPDNSAISFGNRQATYRQRYLAWGAEQPTRPLPARDPGLEAIESPHWRQPVHLDKDPRIVLSFPEAAEPQLDAPEEAVRLVGDRAIVHVEVPDPVTRRYLRDQRFELVAFVDDQRVDEAEQAHLPFNWSWELSGLEPGEHWLTVNLVTFRQLVGTASRRVDVVAEQAEHGR